MTKLGLLLLALVLIAFLGTWLYNKYAKNDCLKEGQAQANGSLGPQYGGPWGECCSGLEPKIRPQDVGKEGAAVYCLKK